MRDYKGFLPTDIAWLAGLLEGEGYVSIKNVSASIGLGMTDKDVVEKVGGLLDAKVRKTRGTSGHKDLYRVEVHGDRAIAVLVLIRPWMGERRTKRIDEVIKFRMDKVKEFRRRDGLCPSCGARPRRGRKAYCKECALSYFRQYNRDRRYGQQ